MYRVMLSADRRVRRAFLKVRVLAVCGVLGSAPAAAQEAPAPEPPGPPKPKPAKPPEPTVKVQTRRRSSQPPATPAPPIDKATATVIADAVRLLSWGRDWPQLAGLVARLADRPPEAEVLKILRRHRADIEAQARRPRD